MQDLINLYDTEGGNKKRLINITKIASDMEDLHLKSLLSLHAFTVLVQKIPPPQKKNEKSQKVKHAPA